MVDWKISWIRQGNMYYDSNLNLFNEGEICYERMQNVNLYDSEGNFVKSEKTVEYRTQYGKVQLDSHHSIVQINYDFYLIAIAGSHKYKENRNHTKQLLSECGIKGFCQYDIDSDFFDKPYEVSFRKALRLNPMHFRTFDYEKYLENYKKALIRYPDFANEINYLKDVNIEMMCKFYNVNEQILGSNSFDRVKFAIKRLNDKINKFKRG